MARPKHRQKRNGLRVAALIAVALVAAGLIWGGYTIREQKKGRQQAEKVLDAMKELIPGLGAETEGSGQMGRDPLAALSVESVDIIGCLEIPALDIEAPVMNKGNKGKYFVTWKSGSPVKGRFRLKGGRHDVFQNLSKANPGDKVIFTDIDGTRYVYQVTTQYHVKDWAKADNDLILCYTVDENTDFVLGCTLGE